MKETSQASKLTCFMLAILCHGTLAFVFFTQPDARIEGGASASQVRLGNAFEDLAAGTLAPAETGQTPREDTSIPEQTPPLRPEPAAFAEQAFPQEVSRALTPEQASPIAPAPVETALTGTAAVPLRSSTGTAARLAATKPMPADPAEKERFVAMAKGGDRLEASQRPRARPVMRRQVNAPASTKGQPADAPRSAKSGSGAQNARAGDVEGKPQARARETGRDGRYDTAGNSAASNYPGLVMRHLARAGKPSVRARGAALIGFTIGPAGHLASLSLTRSSGSSDLDQAALEVVRSAGVFPRPPEGARRAFSVRIEGR